MSADDNNADDDDGYCDICGIDIGLESHYHCDLCLKTTSMMGCGHVGRDGKWLSECIETRRDQLLVRDERIRAFDWKLRPAGPVADLERWDVVTDFGEAPDLNLDPHPARLA